MRGAGNTIVVIEHNLDVIDMGPEGGAGNDASHTGKYLRRLLAAR
jgi:excinuclease UvrABC ATPase subunit